MHIDIWSDIACPWCYIGLARFQRVLGEFEHGESVEVRLRSFQLDPTLPESYEGTETGYLAERKGLSEDQVRQMFGQVAHAAKSEGLALDFDAVKVANSWRAHRLLHAANEADSSGVLTAQLETALFRAHFEDGESISDPEVLLRLASEVGIDDDAAATAAGEGSRALPPTRGAGAFGQGAAADLDRLDQSILADLAEAQQLGISGVPFFVLAGKYGLSGAQPAEVFAGALRQVWDELHPAQAPKLVPIIHAEPAGEACGPDGCD